jgi:hypothetical protein
MDQRDRREYIERARSEIIEHCKVVAVAWEGFKFRPDYMAARINDLEEAISLYRAAQKEHA